MSDESRGQGWWLASDGKWYPPDKAWGAKPRTESTTDGNAESESTHSASNAVEVKTAPVGLAADKAAADPTAWARPQRAANHQRLSEHERRYEYAVERYPKTTVDDEIVATVFQIALNVMARQGWQVKSITETPVGGGVGSNGAHMSRPDTALSKAMTDVLVVFERPVRAASGQDDRPAAESKRRPTGEFERRAILGDVVIEDMATREKRRFAADWPVRIGEHVMLEDRSWVIVEDRSPRADAACRASRN